MADPIDDQATQSSQPPSGPDEAGGGSEPQTKPRRQKGRDADADAATGALVVDAAPGESAPAGGPPRAGHNGHARNGSTGTAPSADRVEIVQGGLPEGFATTIDVRQGGIGRADAQDISVSMGGIGMARGDRVTVELGGIGAVFGGEVEIRQGAVQAIVAREVELEQALVQTVIAANVEIEQQTNVLVLIAGRVEGNVRTLFDWRGALAFGAAFGVIVGLLRRRD